MPWYPSQHWPPAAYMQWYEAAFNFSGAELKGKNGYLDYAVGGGDLLADFAVLGAEQGPGISFRVQDIQALNRAPRQNYGNLGRFFYEHRHDPTALISGEPFPDECCWVDAAFCLNSSNSIARRKTYCNPSLLGAMDWGNPAVLAHRQAMMIEVATTHPQLRTLELDFLRMPLLFNTSRTAPQARRQIMS